MSQAVWDVDAEISDRFELRLPIDARLLSAYTKTGRIHVRAIVDPDANVETVQFALIRSGEVVPEGRWLFVATAEPHPTGRDWLGPDYHVFVSWHSVWNSVSLQ